MRTQDIYVLEPVRDWKRIYFIPQVVLEFFFAHYLFPLPLSSDKNFQSSHRKNVIEAYLSPQGIYWVKKKPSKFTSRFNSHKFVSGTQVLSPGPDFCLHLLFCFLCERPVFKYILSLQWREPLILQVQVQLEKIRSSPGFPASSHHCLVYDWDLCSSVNQFCWPGGCIALLHQIQATGHTPGAGGVANTVWIIRTESWGKFWVWLPIEGE